MATKLPKKFYRIGDYIYYRVGESKKISTHLKQASAAELYSWLASFEKLQKEKEHKRSLPDTQNWSSAKLYPLFLEHQLSQADVPAPSTISCYQAAVRHLQLESWWSREPLATITTEVAEQYIREHRDSDFTPDRDIRFLKQLKRWAISRKKISGDLIDIPTPVGVNNRDSVGRCLTDEEVGALDKAVEESKSPVAKPLYLLAKDLGLRQQEDSKVQRCWIRERDRMLVIPAEFTKIRKGREVPLPQHIMEVIMPYCEGKKPLDPLFSDSPVSPKKRRSLGSWWVDAKTRAGVKCRFHDLRITCATRMAENGITEAVAQDILGHDREIHKIYVKTLSRKRKLEAIDRLYNLDSFLDSFRCNNTESPRNSVQSSANQKTCEPQNHCVNEYLQPTENTRKTEGCVSG